MVKGKSWQKLPNKVKGVQGYKKHLYRGFHNSPVVSTNLLVVGLNAIYPNDQPKDQMT